MISEGAGARHGYSMHVMRGKWKMRKSAIALMAGMIFVLMIAPCVRNQFVTHAQNADPPLFSDGFESGDFSAWNMGMDGNITVENSVVHSGSYATDSWFNGGSQNAVAKEGFMNISGAYAYVRMYTRFDALPASGQEFIPETWFDPNIYEWLVVSIWNNSGTYELSIWNSSTAGNYRFANAAYAFQTNTWYCLEVEVYYASSGGFVSAWIDGQQQINQVALDTAGLGFWGIHVGAESYSMDATFNLYSDDVVIDTSYIGPAPSDSSPPTFSNISVNTTIAGEPCSFNCLISDNVNVSTYVFSTNNTGGWTNDTEVAFSSFFNDSAAWANVTKTLSSTVGNVVSYVWYANDTSDNWSTSGQYNLTTTAPVLHDIAVTSLTSPKKVIFPGLTGNVTTTIVNKGNFSENVTVTVYANMTALANATVIGTFTNVSLSSGDTINLTLSLNTTGFAKGNDTLIACADPVPQETNLTNNNCTDGYIIVPIFGDLTGGTSNSWDFVPNGKVDGKDIAIVAMCYGSAPGCPPPYKWNANCDANDDGKVDGKDITLIALHFGEGGP
jgi:hypothetical protein